MRRAAALLACACLVGAAAPASAAERGPAGWGAGTTGGAGGTTWTVHTRAELKEALAGGGDPTAPKVIHVVGAINGHESDDGSLLGEQDYAPGYDLAKYMSCFGEDGAEWSDTRHDYCKQQRRLRQTGSNKEKAQIQLTVPSNTTLVGTGDDARLLGVFLTVNTGTNIVVRNLRLEAPVDHFTSWSPDDGTQGNWNARFDALTVITGKNLWIDHCTFTDGRFPDRTAPLGFHGERVQRHDGLLDIEDGSDFVTVSDSRFEDHDKAILVGSGDGRGDRDRGHLKVTFLRNLFEDIVQRGPRVRFGQVHVVNNLYVSRGRAPLYALGVGVESALYSERNVFRHDAILAAYGGERFHDTGSWLDRRPARLEAAAAGLGLTDDVGWDPADVYDYRPLTSAAAVERHVLTHAGTGRQYGRP
ncbi:pectate lyase family protein [Streptomyces caeruleatus]|uniref:Pectate lyase n=1 Tax=Streptomyces caeruleatus TaxID=661399 RepID=A0A101U459_9ACTN|nr:pectate lyase [Streptomyces caeruleatus]KUO03684.1 pectate lyase [Streptomyces caeruleatus]